MTLHINTKPHSLMHKTIRYLCLLILPLNILSILLSLFLMNNLRKSFRDSIMASLNTYVSLLEQRMDNTDYLLFTYPNSDSAFIQLFMNYDNWHYNLYRYNITNILENAMNLSDSADAMFVYVPEKDDMILAEDFVFARERIEKSLLVDLIIGQQINKGKWQIVEADGIQYLLRIVDYNNYYFGAYINCSDVLDNLEKNLGMDDTELFLSEQPISPKTGYMLCFAELSLDQTALCCLIRNYYVSGSISVWIMGAIVYLLLSLFIIPLFIFLFRKYINRPLIALQEAFHELEGGNGGYRILNQAYSIEFSDAFNSFNVMAEKTALLRQKALDEERQQHELTVHNLNLRLENLQLQIRPHFLSNTMNLLFTQIQNHREDEAKQLILYISRYFRYMFRHGHDLELFDKEIKLVNEYLTISKMHYVNAFTVSYQVEPVLSLMRFPPLLLHNFVENIIQHALIPGRTIHIVIYGEYDDNRELVTLQVSDDGRGMPDNFIDMINRNDFSSVGIGKHIGIRNSINRLKYYYHDEASVSVESAPDIGTTFTIQIHYHLTMEVPEDYEKGEIL